MDSEKLVLKFQDDDSNKFQFGISFEDIKQINELQPILNFYNKIKEISELEKS